MLTRDEVIWGFRYCLGRNPESESVVAEAQQYDDYRTLREQLMKQPDFRSRLDTRLYSDKGHPFSAFDKKAVVFLHVQKTAGTTLGNLLAANYEESNVCPERFNHLHLHSAAELASYDFFWGHFDLFSTKFIPRRKLHVVSILRQPVDRLLSYYRFARSHPESPSILSDPHFSLAKLLPPVEYFEHDWIRGSPLIDNHYRVVFGGCLEPRECKDEEARIRLELDLATAAVCNLDGLGLQHRLAESVQLIFDALSFPYHGELPHLMSADSMHRHDGDIVYPSTIDLTPRLNEALKDLVLDDDKIYSAACLEFDRRYSEALKSGLLGRRCSS